MLAPKLNKKTLNHLTDLHGLIFLSSHLRQHGISLSPFQLSYQHGSNQIHVTQILLDGVSLPPPAAAPQPFIATPSAPLLDQVVQDPVQHHILCPAPQIKTAFRLFLVSKPDGSARPILDLSPWTPFYRPPSMHLYTAAEVLATIPHRGYLIKIDLTADFFQPKLHCTRQHAGRRYA
jgi:hypothetical protein